jgi:ABC-type transporter Mla MlaB component
MKSIQITVTPRSKGKAKNASITLEGELILKNLHCVADELKETISQFDNIHIELTNIQNIDLACIQLLLAAKQTAASAKKQFSCQAELPKELKNIMQHAGLADLPALLNKISI